MPNVRTKTSRANKMSTSEKKKLAALVREREILWNLNHPLNKDASAYNKAWLDVAAHMGKPKDICRLIWNSLRDCYRYRKNIGKRMLENGEINDLSEYWKSFEGNWEFTKDLAFLADIVRPRTRCITIKADSELLNDAVQNESSVNSFAAEEEFQNESDPISTDNFHQDSSQCSMEEMDQGVKLDDTENHAEISEDNENIQSKGLVHHIGKLVQAQTEFMREFKNGTGTGKFVFQVQLSALDSLLQQLPKNLAEKTLVEMQNYVLKKINEQPRS